MGVVLSQTDFLDSGHWLFAFLVRYKIDKTDPKATLKLKLSISPKQPFKFFSFSINTSLKTQIAQSWMVIRTTTLRPMKFSFRFLDRKVIDTRNRLCIKPCSLNSQFSYHKTETIVCPHHAIRRQNAQ
jgi:hypothetical protein